MARLLLRVHQKDFEMSIAISSAMNSSLLALLGVTDDLTGVQTRLNTGKTVNTASDNAAVYFKAQSFNSKADDLSTVNANIGQAVSNVDTADKAITSMQKNLEGTLQLLRDARAKAVTASRAVATVASTAQAYGSSQTDSTVLVRQRPASAADAVRDANSSAMFQSGDVFSMTLTDAATGRSTTRFFRAVEHTGNGTVGEVSDFATDSTGAVSTTRADGVSQTTAFNFKDMESLRDAINSAFGTNEIRVNVTATTSSGGITTKKMDFALQSDTQSVTFGQTVNWDPKANTASGADRGATFDFTLLFGQYGGVDSAGASVNVSAQAGSSSTGTTYTYAPQATLQTSAREARRMAADAMRATHQNLRTFVNDASLPGFQNLLKGETMDVVLNDTGEVKQAVAINPTSTTVVSGIRTNSLDPGNWFNNISSTNIGGNAGWTTNNYNNDGDMDNAINASTNYLQQMRLSQNVLAQQKTMMQSRFDFNKANIATLKQVANDMTAVNVAEESANQAALTNRQMIATANMNTVRQAEQSLLQLLR
ncbi:flagellin N-terminal helical domain-containing protein [Alsobacter sp. R-9]